MKEILVKIIVLVNVKIKYVEVHWQWCSRKLDRLELVKAQVGVKRLKLLFLFN